MMKRIIKLIGIIICALVASVIGLFCLLVFLALISPKEERKENSSIIIEYNGNSNRPFPDKPELVYADTKEEALTFHVDYYFGEFSYMTKVNDVIKLFENDEYATMFYHCLNEKDKKVEGVVASKFKVRTVNGKKQYALTSLSPGEIGEKKFLKPLVAERTIAPLYDYLAEFSIVEGNRFFYGTTDSEKIKTLKIEGQRPTEIIEYTCFGKTEYFWYYENIISDKPSSEFEIEMEE